MRRARAKVLTRKETHNIIFRASIRPSHRSTNETAALIAADPVDVIVKRYVRLLSREREDRTDQCPCCMSRNVRTYFDIAIEPDGAYFEACSTASFAIQLPTIMSVEDLKRWYPETYRAAAHEGGLIIRDEMMRRFSKWRQRVTMNQQRSYRSCRQFPYLR